VPRRALGAPRGAGGMSGAADAPIMGPPAAGCAKKIARLIVFSRPGGAGRLMNIDAPGAGFDQHSSSFRREGSAATRAPHARVAALPSRRNRGSHSPLHLDLFHL